jgi:hypothetical protein
MPDDAKPRSAGRGLSRRGFLGGVGLAGLLALLFHNALGRLVRPGVGVGAAASPVATLGEHERQTLAAFGRVLVPSSAPSDAADSVIRATLDAHAADAAFLAAAQLLDAQSLADTRVRFVALDGERQGALVRRLLEPYAARTLLTIPYYYASGDGSRIGHLWSAVAQPIVRDFYNSPLGWQVVGYSRRPGACSNLIDYQNPLA